MPAMEIPANQISLREFVVVGEHDVSTMNGTQTSAGVDDSEAIGTSQPPNQKHVVHVGLLSPNRHGGQPTSATIAATYGAAVPWDHLVRIGLLESEIVLNSSNAAHVAGTYHSSFATSLSNSDIELIDSFLRSIKQDTIIYVAHPPIGDLDPYTKRNVRRYSCVGVVLACFRVIGHQLLADCDHPDFPEAERTDVERIYPFVADLSDPLMRKIGLNPAHEPWKIVFPGYLFHALDSETMAFLPTALSQAAFPSEA